ncbi:PfkB family carbohydrate kinase, partial [Bacillus sp. SIMBA_161]
RNFGSAAHRISSSDQLSGEGIIGMPAPSSALVIGEALIDIVEASGGASEHVGGSPANVALGLGRRGVDVTLLTQFGADPRGEAIESHLSESRVRTLVERSEATSTARARIQADGSPSVRLRNPVGGVRRVRP